MAPNCKLQVCKLVTASYQSVCCMLGSYWQVCSLQRQVASLSYLHCNKNCRINRGIHAQGSAQKGTCWMNQEGKTCAQLVELTYFHLKWLLPLIIGEKSKSSFNKSILVYVSTFFTRVWAIVCLICTVGSYTSLSICLPFFKLNAIVNCLAKVLWTVPDEELHYCLCSVFRVLSAISWTYP